MSEHGQLPDWWSVAGGQEIMDEAAAFLSGTGSRPEWLPDGSASGIGGVQRQTQGPLSAPGNLPRTDGESIDAYEKWLKEPLDQRSVPTWQAVARCCGKNYKNDLKRGDLIHFRKLHGIPLEVFVGNFAKNGRLIDVGVPVGKEWRPGEYKPPVNFDEATLAFEVKNEQKAAFPSAVYDAYNRIDPKKRPVPSLKIIVGHSEVNAVKNLTVKHVHNYEDGNGIPKGTLKVIRDKNDNEIGVGLAAGRKWEPWAYKWRSPAGQVQGGNAFADAVRSTLPEVGGVPRAGQGSSDAVPPWENTAKATQGRRR